MENLYLVQVSAACVEARFTVGSDTPGSGRRAGNFVGLNGHFIEQNFPAGHG